eukprot:359024-Chlamydomonas_euryale.AAC.4
MPEHMLPSPPSPLPPSSQLLMYRGVTQQTSSVQPPDTPDENAEREPERGGAASGALMGGRSALSRMASRQVWNRYHCGIATGVAGLQARRHSQRKRWAVTLLHSKAPCAGLGERAAGFWGVLGRGCSRPAAAQAAAAYLDEWKAGLCGYVDVWKAGLCGYVDVWKAELCGYVDVWKAELCGYVDVWKAGLCGYVDVWMAELCGYVDVWKAGYGLTSA